MNWIRATHKSVLNFSRKRQKQQQFLWLIGIILLLIFGYLWYLSDLNFSLLVATGILVSLSFFLPIIALPFLYIWMYFGRILSEIISTVVLAIIFLIGIIPIGLFRRHKNKSTGWEDPRGSSDFDNQY